MEYVESNAAMKVPPPETNATARVAPTLEETARILLEAEATDPDFLTYLWVAAETGGRRGETLALRWGGVDFDAGTVSIDGSVSIGDDGSQLRSRTTTRGPNPDCNAHPAGSLSSSTKPASAAGSARSNDSTTSWLQSATSLRSSTGRRAGSPPSSSLSYHGVSRTRRPEADGNPRRMSHARRSRSGLDGYAVASTTRRGRSIVGTRPSRARKSEAAKPASANQTRSSGIVGSRTEK